MDEVERLISKTEELIQFLKAHDQDHWANWFSESLILTKNKKAEGLQKVLGAYGGMGSFNDLTLQVTLEDGSINIPEESNKRLDQLRGEVGNLASDLWKKHNAAN